MHKYTFEICKQNYNKARQKKNKVINRGSGENPFQTGVSEELAGQKTTRKSPRKKAKKPKKKTEKKSPQKPKINPENNNKKEQPKIKQQTPETSPKNGHKQMCKSLNIKEKEGKKHPLEMPAGGLAQVGGEAHRTFKYRFTPHLRQAAPRQPLVKPLKIKNIIPLKAGQKGAKNVPPTAGTGKRKKPIERIKKPPKTDH